MIRRLASAAVIGCVAALVADLLLQLALAAVRLDGSGWSWFSPLLLERGRWVLAAALVWRLAAIVSLDAPGDVSASIPRSAALALVGRLMLVAPCAWAAATVILRAARVTVEWGWAYEGRIFLTSDFYGLLIVGYAPWALAGILLIALSRHSDPGRGGP
jgi:hypothetical protein